MSLSLAATMRAPKCSTILRREFVILVVVERAAQAVRRFQAEVQRDARETFRIEDIGPAGLERLLLLAGDAAGEKIGAVAECVHPERQPGRARVVGAARKRVGDQAHGVDRAEDVVAVDGDDRIDAEMAGCLQMSQRNVLLRAVEHRHRLGGKSLEIAVDGLVARHYRQHGIAAADPLVEAVPDAAGKDGEHSLAARLEQMLAWQARRPEARREKDADLHAPPGCAVAARSAASMA